MATNFVKASFQEIYDLNTTTNTSTILGVHTPISTRVHQYLHGFFEQYKQFRYDGCSMVFIPVSQLPVDPLQVGTEPGYVDPRDLVNPIVHCGIHGESLGNTLERIFNLTVDKSIYDGLDVVKADYSNNPEDSGYLEQMYYTALASPSFQKAHVQKGFRKGKLVPLTYNMQTNEQLMPFYPGGVDYITTSNEVSTENWGPSDNRYESFGTTTMGITTNTLDAPIVSAGSTATSNIGVQRFMTGTNLQQIRMGPQVFSGGLQRLGWLDTLQNSLISVPDPTVGDNVTRYESGSRWTALPKLYMYLVMMPPCYMQKMYFRVVLTHHYSFRNFRASKGPLSYESLSTSAYPFKPLYGADVTPEPGSPFEPAMAAKDDTLTAINGDVTLITDGVS